MHDDCGKKDVSGIPDLVLSRESPASPSSGVLDRPLRTSAPCCNPNPCNRVYTVLCRLRY